MPFDSATIQQAHDAGYSDDEIYDHLAKSDPKFAAAKQNGYALGDVVKHLEAKAAPKDTGAPDTFTTADEIAAANAAPKWAQNAAGGVIDTVKGLIPRSLTQALGLVTPLVDAAHSVEAGYGTVKDLTGGKSLEETARRNMPEAFALADAQKTEPFSRERFAAGLGMLAQLGMVYAGGKGLEHSMTSRLAPVIGAPEAAPKVTPPEAVPTPELDTLVPFAEKTVPLPTPIDTAPPVVEEATNPPATTPAEPVRAPESGDTGVSQTPLAAGESAGGGTEPVPPHPSTDAALSAIESDGGLQLVDRAGNPSSYVVPAEEGKFKLVTDAQGAGHEEVFDSPQAAVAAAFAQGLEIDRSAHPPYEEQSHAGSSPEVSGQPAREGTGNASQGEGAPLQTAPESGAGQTGERTRQRVSISIPDSPVGVPDLIDFTKEQGGAHLPPKGKRTSLHDDASEAVEKFYKGRLAGPNGKLTADELAQMAYDAGLIKDDKPSTYWQALTDNIENRPRTREQIRAEQKRLVDGEKAARNAVETPTLRPGETQGDLLSKQTEDLSLVGEKGTDFGARQAAAEQAARDAEAAKADQDKAQTSLPLDEHAQAVKLKLKQNKEGGFVNADILQDVADFGKRVLEKGMDFAKWSAEMVKQLGKDVLEHLKPVWDSLSGNNILPHARESGAIGRGNLDASKINAPAAKQAAPKVEEAFKGVKLDDPAQVQAALGKLGLSREDLNAIGATAPGTRETGLLLDAGAKKVRDIADVVGGKSIPKLTRAGVMDEATQHAAARQYVPALVEDLLAKVFPDKYKDVAAMERTIDVIKKDNILGGYDDALKHLEELRNAEHPNTDAIINQEALIQGIEKSQNLAQLDADVRAAKGTDIEPDVHRWEDHVSSLMDSLYNELKGVDPETPRETRGRYFEARMNLLPKEAEARMAEFGDQDKPMPETSVSNYRNPNLKTDKFMRQATLSGEYSSDPTAVLLNSFAGRWNEVTKLRLYDALEQKGVGMVADAGSPSVAEIGGKPAARMPIKYPETDPKTGRTRMVEKSLYVQRDLVEEIRNVLNTDGRGTQNPFFKALTQVQLLQLADATSHIKNIHSIVVNSLGSESIGRDLLRKIPGVGSADAITEITKVSRAIAEDSPAMRAEVAQMSKNGMLRPEYPSTGIQKITRMQALIHDVDTAARVIMNRRFDQLVSRGLAENTIENRRNFVQQIGEYNRRLMHRNEVLLRDYGASPFIVAGRTMNRYARRLVTGSPGFEAASTKAAVAARAAQISGLAMAVTLPAIINAFTTGSMGGRAGTPIGAIDFGEGFDTEDGKHRTLDLMQLNGMRRGLRQTGINAAVEGMRQGKDWNTIAGDAINDAVTTTLHPYIGPGIGGTLMTVTGKRLDLRSGFLGIPIARQIGGGKQYVENLRVALKEQNPFLYGTLQTPIEGAMESVFGIEPPPDGSGALSQTGAGLIKSPLSAVGYKETADPESKGARGRSGGRSSSRERSGRR